MFEGGGHELLKAAWKDLLPFGPVADKRPVSPCQRRMVKCWVLTQDTQRLVYTAHFDLNDQPW